jgi:hypothetical protein
MSTTVQPVDDPRSVDERDFPADGPPETQLRFLLNYAVLATSLYNTQPWLFRIDRDTVELYADRTRGLPVIDPDYRGLTLACGAALFHLRVALEHAGYVPVVELLPDERNRDLLARVRMGDRREPDPESSRLFWAIPDRRLNRQPFEERSVPEHVLDTLRQAASAEGAWLQLAVEARERRALAELIAEGDRVQWANNRFRRELASWIHPARRRDGLAEYALGMGALIIRTFDLGEGRAAQDRELAGGSPVLAVLGTRGDTRRDWLAAGQAAGRVLLRAQSERVSASYLNQPVEVEELRPRLMEALATGPEGTPPWTSGRSGHPQLLLRLGYGPPIDPAPRRLLSEVIIGERAMPDPPSESAGELLYRDSYTPEELSRLLGISIHLIRHDAFAGTLKAHVHDHQILSIPRTAVLDWLRERDS